MAGLNKCTIATQPHSKDVTTPETTNTAKSSKDVTTPETTKAEDMKVANDGESNPDKKKDTSDDERRERIQEMLGIALPSRSTSAPVKSDNNKKQSSDTNTAESSKDVTTSETTNTAEFSKDVATPETTKAEDMKVANDGESNPDKKKEKNYDNKPVKSESNNEDKGETETMVGEVSQAEIKRMKDARIDNATNERQHALDTFLETPMPLLDPHWKETNVNSASESNIQTEEKKSKSEKASEKPAGKESSEESDKSKPDGAGEAKSEESVSQSKNEPLEEELENLGDDVAEEVDKAGDLKLEQRLLLNERTENCDDSGVVTDESEKDSKPNDAEETSEANEEAAKPEVTDAVKAEKTDVETKPEETDTEPKPKVDDAEKKPE